MFSVVFPGQGSQIVGMGKEFFDKFNSVKRLFEEADDTLKFSLSSIVLEGPKDKLDLTENTQPAIFLISYSIFDTIINKFNINLKQAKYFAGHSLGEYSALSSAGYLSFSDTIKLLRKRGSHTKCCTQRRRNGSRIRDECEKNENILFENKNEFKVQIANDNSDGQIVCGGKTNDLNTFIEIVKNENIKNIRLSVSAPFHSF